jgi:hypothetical protein
MNEHLEKIANWDFNKGIRRNMGDRICISLIPIVPPETMTVKAMSEIAANYCDNNESNYTLLFHEGCWFTENKEIAKALVQMGALLGTVEHSVPVE